MLEIANRGFQAQIRDLSAKFNLLIKAYVQVLFLLYSFRIMLGKIVLEFGQAFAALNMFRSIRSVLEPWVQRLSFLPDNLDKAEVLAIVPRDFGYDSWLDPTPDSGFFERYILRSHLINGSAAQGNLPAVFPDFLWKFSPDYLEDRGLAAWLSQGPPSGFPFGHLAVDGHREWYRRMSEVIDAVFEFVGVFRRVVWPSADSLSLGD